MLNHHLSDRRDLRVQLLHFSLQSSFAFLQLLVRRIRVSIWLAGREAIEVDRIYSSLDLTGAERDDGFAPLIDGLLVSALFKFRDELGDNTW